MRRALRPRLPTLARIYGITPNMVDEMPVGELLEFLDDLDQMAENARRRKG